MNEYPQLEQYLNNLNIKREEFTQDEKLVIRKIMSQIDRTGHSNLLESLYYEDYEEIPVSIEQFITDTDYLGNATIKDNIPGKAVWPSWRQTLTDLFSSTNPTTLAIFSGAIGTGKTSNACIGINYILYKLLCLKDPTSYYDIMPNSRIGIALFNVTLVKGFGVAFHRINSACRSSPWFLRHGEEIGNNSNRKIYLPDKDISITVGSDSSHFTGLDIFAAFLDEISDKDNKEIDMLKTKAYNTLTTITRRMESRFQDQGIIPGMTFIVSSTKHEDDFLTQFKERERHKPHVKIIEKPLWEAVPADRYKGEKFNLVISNTSTDAFITKDDEEVEQYKDNYDYQLFKVPMEHYEVFHDDIMGSIRDILGKPLKTAGKFILTSKITDAIDSRWINCLKQTEIKLGFDDGSSILDYFDLARLNPKVITYPLFVHHDLALGQSDKADAAGLCISAVARDISRDDLGNPDETHSWVFIPVLWCQIRSLKHGQQIPFYKIREAVKELRDQYGFNIMGISADGYQSIDMLQQYQLMGFETFRLSMDAPPSDGYMFFRSALYNRQVFIPDDKLLIRELTQLIENRVIQKVDHPNPGGSKDLADGFAGSIWCSVVFNKKAKDKNKRRIFDDGGFLLADLITGTKDKPKNTQIDMNKEVDSILKEIGSTLFQDFDNNDDGFNIY